MTGDIGSVVRRLPALAWEALLLELALYRSLARWVARRPDVPREAEPIGYSRLVVPMLWLWIFGSAVEVVVLDVVLHRWWPAGRLPFLVLGIWGVLWMLGMLASMRVRPHLLTDTVIVLRSGARTRVVVPLETVVSTRLVEHELPGVVKSLHVEEETPESGSLALVLVGVGSRTNLELVLGGPTRLHTSTGEVTASRVGLWADEPREVADLLRRRRSAQSSR